MEIYIKEQGRITTDNGMVIEADNFIYNKITNIVNARKYQS